MKPAFLRKMETWWVYLTLRGCIIRTILGLIYCYAYLLFERKYRVAQRLRRGLSNPLRYLEGLSNRKCEVLYRHRGASEPAHSFENQVCAARACWHVSSLWRDTGLCQLPSERRQLPYNRRMFSVTYVMHSCRIKQQAEGIGEEMRHVRILSPISLVARYWEWG